LLVTALWGGTFAIIKTAIDDVPASTFTAVRFATATALSMLLWYKSMRGWDAAFARRGTILGSLYGMGFVLQAIGLSFTTATSSALITGSAVAFVPIVFRFVDKTKIRRMHIVAVAGMLVGLYIFTMPDVHTANVGDLLTLCSAFVWALYIVYLDIFTQIDANDQHKLNGLVIMQFAVTAVMSGIAALFVDRHTENFVWSGAVIGGIAYCAIAASIITTWVQTTYQRFTHPIRAGIIFTAEPVFGVIIAWIALGETITSIQAVGACVMIGAIVIPDVVLLIRGVR